MCSDSYTKFNVIDMWLMCWRRRGLGRQGWVLGSQGIENMCFSTSFRGFRDHWFFKVLGARGSKIMVCHWFSKVLARSGVENIGFSLVFQDSGRWEVENTGFSLVFSRLWGAGGSKMLVFHWFFKVLGAGGSKILVFQLVC